MTGDRTHDTLPLDGLPHLYVHGGLVGIPFGNVRTSSYHEVALWRKEGSRCQKQLKDTRGAKRTTHQLWPRVEQRRISQMSCVGACSSYKGSVAPDWRRGNLRIAQLKLTLRLEIGGSSTIHAHSSHRWYYAFAGRGEPGGGHSSSPTPSIPSTQGS